MARRLVQPEQMQQGTRRLAIPVVQTPSVPTSEELDIQSAEKYKPTFAATTGLEGGYSEVLKTVGNVPSSAIQFGKNIVKVFNPVTNIKGAIKSAAEFGGSVVEAKQEGVKTSDVLKEIFPAAYKTLVPKFFQELFKGNTEEAQRIITNDPVGQLAPIILTGRAVAQKTGYGPQFDKIMSKTASPITKGTPALLKEIVKPVLTKAQPKLQSSLTESYRQMINPTGKQASVEARFGKNTPELLVKEGIKLKVHNGKLDPTEAIDQLKNIAQRENPIFESLLQSERKYTTFDVMEKAMKNNVTAKGTDYYSAIKHIENEMSAYRSQFADQSITLANGKQAIPLEVVNVIKSDLWSKTKGFNDPVSALRADTSYISGKALQKIIENSVTDIKVKTISQRLGDIASATHLLEKRANMPIAGGIMNRYFARVIGAIGGTQGGPLGVVLGTLTADKLITFLRDTQITANIKLDIINQLKSYKEGTRVVAEMEKIIKMRAEEALNRPQLPAPSFIPAPPRGYAPGQMEENLKQILGGEDRPYSP